MHYFWLQNIWNKAVFFLLFTNVALGQELLPFVENFSKLNYKGDNQVWNAVQGKDNAMYFANNRFLLRYNGVSWEKYTLPGKTIIRSVFSDKNKIYTGSYNEFGYWQRENGILKYYSLSKNKGFFQGKSNNEEIWKIFKFGGSIFFQSFNDFYIKSNQKITKIRLPFQISYCFPIEKKLYIASVNKGIYLYENNKFIKIEKWNSIKNNIIHHIDIIGNEIYIFTKNNGVYVDKNNALQEWQNPVNKVLKSELIIASKFINNNKLAVGTAFNGIYIFNLTNNTYQNINRANSLKNNSVLSIATDNEKDLWLGLDNGIAHIEVNSPIEIFSDNTGKLGSVYAIATTKNGYLLGSNHGIFDLNNKKLHFVNDSQGQVWEINKVNNQYIIGHNDGTFAYKDGLYKKLNSVNGGWKLLKDSYSNRYFQGDYSGIEIYKDCTFTEHERIGNLIKPIRNIAQIKEKELWVVDNFKNLFKISLKKDISKSLIENVLQKNKINNKFNVKIFKFKQEIYFYIENKWYTENNLTKKLELNNFFNTNFKNISDIIPVNDKLFLVLKKEKIHIISQYKNQFIWQMIPAKYYEGKIVNEDTKAITKNNKIIINLDDGFLVFSPKLIQDKPTQNYTIEAFYENKLITENTTIKYNKPIELNIISSFHGYNKKNCFYTINNSDNYILVENGKINVTNLNTGNQEIDIFIQQQNKFKKVANFNFQVAEPWYFSWYMFLLYFFVLYLIFYFYYKWNKIRYEEKIKLKNKEITHHKEIIELELNTQNKLKIQEIEKTILENQVISKTSEVAGKSLSIAKQYEMIESIQKILDQETNIDKIKINIKKAIKINSINKKEWNSFEKNLLQSHKDFVEKLTKDYPLLTPKDIKLCIYLKMDLSSKEIAPLMSISFRGVELHRYRLRKKLNLNPEQNLSKFLITL